MSHQKKVLFWVAKQPKPFLLRLDIESPCSLFNPVFHICSFSWVWKNSIKDQRSQCFPAGSSLILFLMKLCSDIYQHEVGLMNASVLPWELFVAQDKYSCSCHTIFAFLPISFDDLLIDSSMKILDHSYIPGFHVVNLLHILSSICYFFIPYFCPFLMSVMIFCIKQFIVLMILLIFIAPFSSYGPSCSSFPLGVPASFCFLFLHLDSTISCLFSYLVFITWMATCLFCVSVFQIIIFFRHLQFLNLPWCAVISPPSCPQVPFKYLILCTHGNSHFRFCDQSKHWINSAALFLFTISHKNGRADFSYLMTHNSPVELMFKPFSLELSERLPKNK